MKTENAVSQKFLLNYPTEAARTLEQLEADNVAALFSELSVVTSAPVLAAMLPEKSVACLELIQLSHAAKLLAEMPLASAARLYRMLKKEKQQDISALFSQKMRQRLQRYIEYPALSVGAMLDPWIDVLPDMISVAEAIRRIERLEHPVKCELYIIDSAHKLVGMLELGRLLTSSHHEKLHDVMNKKSQAVSVHALSESLLTHPGWKTRGRLPVIDRDKTLLGALEYRSIQETIGIRGMNNSPDAMENLLSLASLYWISMAELLSSLFSMNKSGKGGR